MYVVWADSDQSLNKILKERCEDGNILIKVMADGGQDFSKICLTVISENYSDELNESSDGKYLKKERSS